MFKLSNKKILTLLVLVGLAAIAVGCEEITESGKGLVFLPVEVLGGLPVELKLTRAAEITSVPGEVVGKGDQLRLFVGRRGQFEIRTLLAFRVDLPQDAQISSATVQLYVVNVNGQLPVNLSIHLLERPFSESEVTYSIAQAGEIWSSPGGDFTNAPLGETIFEGNRIDTVTMALDVDALSDFLSTGEQTLSFIVLGADEEVYLTLISRESIPNNPIASRLDLQYSLSGGTTVSLFERRAFRDASIAAFRGPPPAAGHLLVGETPASQVFFSYDLSALPPLATVNQARLHLSIAGGAFVDSFRIGAFVAPEPFFINPAETVLGTPQGIGAENLLLELDVTLPLQKLLLESETGLKNNYIALSSFSSINIAGFVEFYSSDWPDTLQRPYLEIIYTDVPETAKPLD